MPQPGSLEGVVVADDWPAMRTDALGLQRPRPLVERRPAGRMPRVDRRIAVRHDQQVAVRACRSRPVRSREPRREAVVPAEPLGRATAVSTFCRRRHQPGGAVEAVERLAGGQRTRRRSRPGRGRRRLGEHARRGSRRSCSTARRRRGDGAGAAATGGGDGRGPAAAGGSAVAAHAEASRAPSASARSPARPHVLLGRGRPPASWPAWRGGAGGVSTASRAFSASSHGDGVESSSTPASSSRGHSRRR